MGAFGGVEHGWERVAERLDWASAGIRASGRRVENLLTVVGEDLACTTEDRYSVGQLGAEEAARRLVALAPGFKYLPERWP